MHESSGRQLAVGTQAAQLMNSPGHEHHGRCMPPAACQLLPHNCDSTCSETSAWCCEGCKERAQRTNHKHKGALVPRPTPQLVHAGPPLVLEAQHCPQRPDGLPVEQPALLPYPGDQPCSLSPAKQGGGVREGSTQAAQVAGHELCLQQHQLIAEGSCLQAGGCWPVSSSLAGWKQDRGIPLQQLHSHPEHCFNAGSYSGLSPG